MILSSINAFSSSHENGDFLNDVLYLFGTESTHMVPLYCGSLSSNSLSISKRLFPLTHLNPEFVLRDAVEVVPKDSAVVQ